MAQTQHHCCGNPLDLLETYEVIPAGQLAWRGDRFTLTEDGDDPDRVLAEYRCGYCGDPLDFKQQQWVRMHLSPELLAA